MLTIIMGKTCSGKDTVVSKLCKIGWQKVITYTSRPKRRGEKDGRNYHFISEEEFSDKIKGGCFAEWKSYNVNGDTWYYGTPLDEIIDAATDNEKHIIILTPKGVEDIISLLSKYTSDYKINIIYLYANRSTILDRLQKRKDKNDSIERRMRADDIDFMNAVGLAHKIVYNNDSDSIDDVVNKIVGYAKSADE